VLVQSYAAPQNWDKPIYATLLHVSALVGHLQGEESTGVAVAKYI